MAEIQALFMDHIVFEDTDFMDNEDFFNRTESSQLCPVHIHIRRELGSGFIPLRRNLGIKLIYSENRKITIIIDGNRTCLCSGEFALISHNALYSMALDVSNVQQDVMMVWFHPDYLRQMCPLIWDHEISRDAPGAAKEEKIRMVMLCERLLKRSEESSENERRYFETNQLLFTVLQLIFRDFLVKQQKNSPRQYAAQSKMAKVFDYLLEHYRENLTTQSVADHFWYSREYFCRLFKRYANETFKSYLTELRLSAAERELRISDKKVAQIAIEQGFPDEKSFFSAFKKKYGMTPAHWREKCLMRRK